MVALSFGSYGLVRKTIAVWLKPSLSPTVASTISWRGVSPFSPMIVLKSSSTLWIARCSK